MTDMTVMDKDNNRQSGSNPIMVI